MEKLTLHIWSERDSLTFEELQDIGSAIAKDYPASSIIFAVEED